MVSDTTAQYLDFYRRDTDARIDQDPHEAVGGMWELIGRLQFDYLVTRGLVPNSRVLDIGCGTLRGGRHFIRYLEARNYTGIDISAKAIEYGVRLVIEEGLQHKLPRLLLNRDMSVRFGEFTGETFDFLIAQSVFTHLMPESIDECFAHVGGIMHRQSLLFFTFYAAPVVQRISYKSFAYPFSYFETLADKYQFSIQLQNDYNHPRQQLMASIQRRGN